MIPNPLCPTPSAPKEMLPSFSFLQGSVCEGEFAGDKINEKSFEHSIVMLSQTG
jgi:hypothetical protein